MAEKEYVRLTRAKPRARFAVISSGSSSLWLGKDHLLCIDTTGYTENYKRFYFRDIQAFLIRKTDRYKWWGIVTAVMAAGCLFSAALSGEIVIKYILGIMGVVFALVFLINLALGPSCVCQLRTAVQIEELPSLSSLRKWRKTLERVRPLIVAAQGVLTPEEISTRVRQGSAVETIPASGSRNPTTSPVEDPNTPPRIV